MMIELMKERAGADEAYFTFIYTEMPDQERFRRIMTRSTARRSWACSDNSVKAENVLPKGEDDGNRKTEKKIRNYRKFAIECLTDAVKYHGERQLENDEKKIRKLDKKVEGKRHMAAVYIRDLNKMGYDFSGFMESLELEQAQVVKELFPYGLGKEVIDDHKARNFNIGVYKKRIKKLKELEAKYEPYDPTLPVKEKLKNRIYKAEIDIGWYMLIESKKDSKS
ncbi:MAG: hypothetical protein V8Q42_08985 [Anaerovoracaceae bacterium]